MPLDTFICGTCMTSFNDIEQFILHKNDICTKPESDKVEQVNVEPGESVSVADMVHIPESTGLNMGKPFFN